MTTHEHERSQPSNTGKPGYWPTSRRAALALGWVLGLSLAVVALAVGGTLTFARTDRGRETVRRIAVAQARKSIPGLQIGRIEGDYLRDLILRDIEVRDERGQPAVHVGRLSLRYRLGALWRRTLSVGEIEIDGVAVTARPDGRGGLNLAHLTVPSEPAESPAPQGKPSGWKVQVDRILVSRVTGTLELPDGRTGSLAGLDLDAAARMDGQRLQAEIATLSASGTWEAQSYAASLSGGALSLAPSEVEARLAALRVTGLFPEGTPLVLRLDARGPPERVSTTLDLDGGAAGRVHLAGTAGVISDAQGNQTLGSYDLSVTLSDVDPGGIKADAPRGAINLRLRAAGDGIVRAPGSRAALALEILPSHLEGYAFSSSRVAASLGSDRWEVARAVLLRTAGASLTVEGHGAGNDVAAALALDVAGPMRQLPAANGIAGRGRIDIHAEGKVPDRLAVEVKGNLAGVRVGPSRVATLRVSANARLQREPGLAMSAAKLSAHGKGMLAGLRVGETRVRDGSLAFDVQGSPAHPSGTVEARAREVLAGAGWPEIATLALTASGSPGGALALRAAAEGPRVHAGVRAHGTATADAADVSLDGLSLDVTTKAYRQKLDLDRPARIRFRAGEEFAVDHLAVHGTGARFTGSGVLDGTYRLPPSRREPLAHLTLDLRKVSVGGLTPTDARLDATLEERRAKIQLDATMPSADAQLHLDADLPMRTGPGGPRLASHGPTLVHVKSNKIRLQEIPDVERKLARQGITGGTASVDLSVSGDIAHPDARGAFDVRDVMYRNIAGIGRDSTLKTVPGLGGSLAIDTRPGSSKIGAHIFIRNTGILDAEVRSSTDLGQIIAGIDLGSLPIHAALHIPRFRLASLTDFSDGFKGLQGELYGQLEVSGTVRRPSGRADLAIDGAQVDEVRFREVKLHADGDQGRLAASLSAQQVVGGRLDGSVTVERSQNDRLRASLTGKDLDVGFARLFLTNVRELGGMAQLSASAEGTVEAPKIRASLTFDKGRIGVTGQPTFHDVHANATLEPGRVDLHDLQMQSGGGRFDGKGWASLGGESGLSPRSAVFTARAHHFLVAAEGSTGAQIDGDLAVNAALREDVLSGKVEIPDANIWLPKGPPTGSGRNLQKVGPHADVHFVDPTALAAAERAREKQRRAAASALKLAVVATAKPVYIRGKDLDIEVRSDIQIGTVPSGPHAGAPTISGGIHIPRGRINIQGQRFDFDHGDVTFNGSSEIDPQLDLKLSRQFPEALVIIELRGTPKKPQLRLTSDPSVYDQAQIVSLILTGQTGGQPSTGKSFDPTAAVATAVLSKLADQVAPALGLDVLRVEGQDVKNDKGEATGDTDTRVEVGKYVTERIYLSYAHIFGAPDNANQNEAHVEYRMTRRVVMETVFGDAGQGGLDTLFTYRF
jgi:autotransporter translocation and assembly factor TamB